LQLPAATGHSGILADYVGALDFCVTITAISSNGIAHTVEGTVPMDRGNA
jgi:hypothetical protein